MNQVFQTGIFSILPSSGVTFEVTAPADGDVLTSGETTTISWMPDIGADRYRIFYFDADGTAHDIALVGNVTSYSWTVPDVASQEDGKRIRIKSFAGSTTMNIVWQVGSFSIAP